MITQELLNYIKNERKSGKTDDSIRESLLSNNWKDEDITKAFDLIKIKLRPGLIYFLTLIFLFFFFLIINMWLSMFSFDMFFVISGCCLIFAILLFFKYLKLSKNSFDKSINYFNYSTYFISILVVLGYLSWFFIDILLQDDSVNRLVFFVISLFFFAPIFLLLYVLHKECKKYKLLNL